MNHNTIMRLQSLLAILPFLVAVAAAPIGNVNKITQLIAEREEIAARTVCNEFGYCKYCIYPADSADKSGPYDPALEARKEIKARTVCNEFGDCGYSVRARQNRLTS
jgi:hypothetical protein